VAHRFSFLYCVFGGVCVAHRFSFLCCVVVYLRLVSYMHPMLSMSLDCPFLISLRFSQTFIWTCI
jgi:hypothetical protein